jgi:hypothetical protein
LSKGKLIGHVRGHRLLLELDDTVITAELRKRGVWGLVEHEVRLGRSWLLAYPTEQGLDVFLWLGKAGDSGFALYQLEGVTPVCPASFQLLTALRGTIKKIDRQELFEMGDSRSADETKC